MDMSALVYGSNCFVPRIMTQQIDKGVANEIADSGKQIRSDVLCFCIKDLENISYQRARPHYDYLYRILPNLAFCMWKSWNIRNL